MAFDIRYLYVIKVVTQLLVLKLYVVTISLTNVQIFSVGLPADKKQSRPSLQPSTAMT